MELVVDLTKVTVVLAGAPDLSSLRLRVAVPADASPDTHDTVHRLGDVLEAAYTGRLVDVRHAYIRPDAVAFHAAGQVDEEWESRFAAYCAEAVSSGRVSPDGALAAPVSWPGDA